MMDQFISVIDNSSQIMNEFTRKVKQGCRSIGMTAEGYAKRFCPVGTPESTGIPGYKGGTLRGSITYEIITDTDTPGIYIGTNVWYAKYVEFIDRYRHKPPTGAHFLRNAAANHGEEYGEIMKAALR